MRVYGKKRGRGRGVGGGKGGREVITEKNNQEYEVTGNLQFEQDSEGGSDRDTESIMCQWNEKSTWSKLYSSLPAKEPNVVYEPMP